MASNLRQNIRLTRGGNESGARSHRVAVTFPSFQAGLPRRQVRVGLSEFSRPRLQENLSRLHDITDGLRRAGADPDADNGKASAHSVGYRGGDGHG